jgi:phage-related protein
LETLAGEFENNEEASAQVFGNVRALSGVLDLMGSNADVTRQIFANMADNTGDLDAAFAVVADTSAFNFAQALAELKEAFRGMGDIMIPVMMQLTEGFRGMVAAFQALSPEQQEQVIKFLALVAAIGPVVLIAGKLITAIGAIIKVIALLNTALIFLAANPVGLVILAIAALIAIGVAIWKNWDAIQAKASEVWTSVKDAITGAWEGIKNAIRPIVNAVLGYYNALISGVESAINAIARAINRIPSISIPSWVPLFGGKSYSIPKVPEMSFPRIPMLADGGIVTRQTLAIIGEAGPEAVIPLNLLDQMGGSSSGNISITVNGALDAEGTARTILRVLQDAERRTGVRL